MPLKFTGALQPPTPNIFGGPKTNPSASSISNVPTPKPVPPPPNEDRLMQFYRIALTITGDDEAARIFAAIAAREGGLHGGVGDTRGGGSFGPLQFYSRGQLPNFAEYLGTNPTMAARIAQDPTQWDKVAQFAWQGYLGNAIRTGRNLGLSGPALASYASKYGQRSVAPGRSGERYGQLFGPPGPARLEMGPRVLARMSEAAAEMPPKRAVQRIDIPETPSFVEKGNRDVVLRLMLPAVMRTLLRKG